MEKMYSDAEYATLANEAQAEGKIVYKIQGLTDYNIEVYEYEKKIVQVPVYNDKGEIIDYEDKEVDDLTKPVMIEVIDPITGETVRVQKHHTETRQKMAERIEKQYKGYYICSSANITDGTLNPDFEQEQTAREREKLNKLSLTKREVFLALYKAKGLTPQQLRSTIKDTEALIEFDYANDYLRAIRSLTQSVRHWVILPLIWIICL